MRLFGGGVHCPDCTFLEQPGTWCWLVVIYIDVADAVAAAASFKSGLAQCNTAWIHLLLFKPRVRVLSSSILSCWQVNAALLQKPHIEQVKAPSLVEPASETAANVVWREDSELLLKHRKSNIAV
jgi:hypothetical protein